MPNVQEIGKGVVVEVKGGKVIITFDENGDYGRSASGKTTIVATTSGNVTLSNGVTIGVNAYRK